MNPESSRYNPGFNDDDDSSESHLPPRPRYVPASRFACAPEVPSVNKAEVRDRGPVLVVPTDIVSNSAKTLAAIFAEDRQRRVKKK